MPQPTLPPATNSKYVLYSPLSFTLAKRVAHPGKLIEAIQQQQFDKLLGRLKPLVHRQYGNVYPSTRSNGRGDLRFLTAWRSCQSFTPELIGSSRSPWFRLTPRCFISSPVTDTPLLSGDKFGLDLTFF